jgi:hypothetical protein
VSRVQIAAIGTEILRRGQVRRVERLKLVGPYPRELRVRIEPEPT